MSSPRKALSIDDARSSRPAATERGAHPRLEPTELLLLRPRERRHGSDLTGPRKRPELVAVTPFLGEVPDLRDLGRRGRALRAVVIAELPVDTCELATLVEGCDDALVEPAEGAPHRAHQYGSAREAHGLDLVHGGGDCRFELAEAVLAVHHVGDLRNAGDGEDERKGSCSGTRKFGACRSCSGSA